MRERIEYNLREIFLLLIANNGELEYMKALLGYEGGNQ